jgi:DtxR family Mn-dependent transcriptional regulator
VEERDGKVTNSALARELDVSAAAITEMIRKLADSGYVKHRKYRGIELTETGLQEAVDLTRRHRLWEVFLIDRLDFAWDQVHALADQLEHISSDELINRLDDYLGNPTHDPHGDPIPDRHGSIRIENWTTIAEYEPGEVGVVGRVSDEYPELLRYASSLGLDIGSQVTVLERIEFDGSIRLEVDSRPTVISEKLARSVYLKPERNARS